MTKEFDGLFAAAEERCVAIRRGGFGPYGKLLRTTAQEMLAGMFPRFSALRGPKGMAADVEAFCVHHGAARAQFVQLGTEFVEFMQKRLTDGMDCIVLEYEWLLFETEVHPAFVHAWTASAGQSHGSFGLNPTLRWVASPIDLFGLVPPDLLRPEENAPHVYAIYRRADHSVVTQPLNAVDVERLQPFEEGAVMVSPPFDSWLSDALRKQILSHPSTFEAHHGSPA